MHLDYSAVLFCLLTATGAVWLADVVLLRRARRARAEAALDAFDRHAPSPIDLRAARDQRMHLRERLSRTPGWIELSAGFFPVLFTVFLLRSSWSSRSASRRAR